MGLALSVSRAIYKRAGRELKRNRASHHSTSDRAPSVGRIG